MEEPTRRRSPAWIRRLDSRTIHGMAGRFLREQRQRDLSKGQEWLWRSLISELEYRRRSTTQGWLACSCALCVRDPLEAELTNDAADVAAWPRSTPR